MVGLPRVVRSGFLLSWGGMIWLLSDNQLPVTGDGDWSPLLGNFAHGPLFGFLGLFAIAWLVSAKGERGVESVWQRIRPSHLIGGILLVLVYGVIDEWHQSMTPGRVPSLGDVLTDVLGATAVAATIAHLDPSGANGRRLWWLFALAVAALLLSASTADWLPFPGV